MYTLAIPRTTLPHTVLHVIHLINLIITANFVFYKIMLFTPFTGL
jgi:hypothetical protein